MSFCFHEYLSQNHISSYREIQRKTYSLLATRSHLVKVFRFQRKTLLFSFGFFFPIIIIIIIIFLTDFVHAISRKLLYQFS